MILSLSSLILSRKSSCWNDMRICSSWLLKKHSLFLSCEVSVVISPYRLLGQEVVIVFVFCYYSRDAISLAVRAFVDFIFESFKGLTGQKPKFNAFDIFPECIDGENFVFLIYCCKARS